VERNGRLKEVAVTCSKYNSEFFLERLKETTEGPSTAQSFSCPSPAGLISIFYFLEFQTSPFLEGQVLVIMSQEQGVPVVPSGTGFLFRYLLIVAGLLCGCCNAFTRAIHNDSFSLLRCPVIERTGNASSNNACSVVAGESTSI
jgi:hypothetical protein